MIKGTKLVVTGSIRTSSYEKNGEKRDSTEINVDDIEFAGGAKGSRDAGSPAPEAASSSEEEIPF